MGCFSHVCCVCLVIPMGIGIIKERGIVLFHKKFANERTIMLMKEGVECSNPWRLVVPY